MSDQDLQEEFNPLYRVIGAVVLVALAVVFVPIILDKSELPSLMEAQRSELKSDSEATPDQTKVVVTSLAEIKRRHQGPTVVAKKPETSAENTKLAKILEKVREKAPVAESAASRGGSTEQQKKIDTKTVVKKPDVSISSAGLRKGWVVQLGTYKNKQNATRLKRRLADHGYKVRLEGAKIGQERAIRVRVGPFREKITATNMLSSINRDLGVDGVVLSLQ